MQMENIQATLNKGPAVQAAKPTKMRSENVTVHYGAKQALNGINLDVPERQVTALIGPEAAMACTAAVETEIDNHYSKQLDQLHETGEDPELAAMIEEFREDEREHRDAALAAGAERAPAYPLLSGLIRLGCRAAIRISERV